LTCERQRSLPAFQNESIQSTMEGNISSFHKIEFKPVDVDAAIAKEREDDLRKMLKDLAELSEVQKILSDEMVHWKEDVEKMDLAVELADQNMRAAVFFIAEVC
jgi:multidrug resistance efflux pump